MRYTKINLKLKRTNFARAPPRFASIRRVEGERRKEWGWANEGREKEEGGTMEGERAATRDWAALARECDERTKWSRYNRCHRYLFQNKHFLFLLFLFSLFFLLSSFFFLFSRTHIRISRNIYYYSIRILQSVWLEHIHMFDTCRNRWRDANHHLFSISFEKFGSREDKRRSS